DIPVLRRLHSVIGGDGLRFDGNRVGQFLPSLFPATGGLRDFRHASAGWQIYSASSRAAISVKLRVFACWIAVMPSRSGMVRSAPASRRSLTICWAVGPPSVRITASRSAVQPRLLT